MKIVKHSKQHSYKRQECVGSVKGRSLAKWNYLTNSPIFSENGEVEMTKIKASDVIVPKYKQKSKRVTSGKRFIKTQQEIENMVRKKNEDNFYTDDFGVKGRGVRAKCPFAKNQYVIEYAGELISGQEGKIREKDFGDNEDIGSYLYFFEHETKLLCIDATVETEFKGRLINHSKDNANLKTKVLVVDGKPHLVFFAKRNIKEDEELLFAYGENRGKVVEINKWLAI